MDQAPTKHCTNCTRGPQPLSEFEGKNGRPCNTCSKCREKGKKYDQKTERKEYHTELQKERGKDYCAKHREKLKTGGEEKEHNLEQKCNWAKSDKSKERLSNWKKLNIHDRIGSSRRQANVKGIEWHLSDAEAELMMTAECVYCGHLDLEVCLNGIDRLNQQGNYTTENTVACCWTCNFMKGCMDPKTFVEKARIIGRCTREFPGVPVQPRIRLKRQAT
jgi:hypothetical protein